MKRQAVSACVDSLASACLVALWSTVGMDPLRGFLGVALLTFCAAVVLAARDHMAAGKRAQ